MGKSSSASGKESNFLKFSLLATVLLYALTAFHHYYGAKVYNTPWRAHVVLFGEDGHGAKPTGGGDKV